MKYVTLLHALNIPCRLDTFGDWHKEALDWRKIHVFESNDSIFKDYGIELNKTIPCNEEKYNVANHIRACLDMLDIGNFALARWYE